MSSRGKGESSVNALERSSVMADKVADGSPTYDEMHTAYVKGSILGWAIALLIINLFS